MKWLQKSWASQVVWKSISHSEENPAGSSMSQFWEIEAKPTLVFLHSLTEKTYCCLLVNFPIDAKCPSYHLLSSSLSPAEGSRHVCRHVVWEMQPSGSFHLGCLEKEWRWLRKEMKKSPDRTELKLRGWGKDFDRRRQLSTTQHVGNEISAQIS